MNSIEMYDTQKTFSGPPPLSLEDSIIGRGNGLFMIVPVDGPEDPEVR